MSKKKIKFENYSVSGIYREYAGFALKVPGHSIGVKAVIADVPAGLVNDIKKFITSRHPAVVVTDMPLNDQAPIVEESAKVSTDDDDAEQTPDADTAPEPAAVDAEVSTPVTPQPVAARKLSTRSKISKKR